MDKKRIWDALNASFVKQEDGSYIHPDEVERRIAESQRLAKKAEFLQARVMGNMAKGFSLVCAFCNRLQEGLDVGLPHCGVIGCCGPKHGGEFTQYEGELPRSAFGNWCLVCAEKATGGFRAKGGTVLFGVCQDHKAVFFGKGGEPRMPDSREGEHGFRQSDAGCEVGSGGEAEPGVVD